MTADLKGMILGALDAAGGQQYLADQAAANPTAFLTLLGKVLPMQVTGTEGGAVHYTFEWAPATPAEPPSTAPVIDAESRQPEALERVWARDEAWSAC